jgi:hypothetical protein
MRRLVCRGLLVAALIVPMAACEDTEVPTEPDPDNPVLVTDTFNGTLNQNGAATFTFRTASAGDVRATLTLVQPDPATGLGLAIGTWDTTTSNCQEVLSNDNAVQGSIIVGAVSRQADICVRLRDVGKLTGPLTFTLIVVHP